MSNATNHTPPADRGVSELVGVVVLFGIVVAGSAMIFVSGTAVTDDVRAEGRVDAAETAFVQMDSSVQSLAQNRGSSREAVSIGTVDPNRAEVRDTGRIQVQINEESACTATMDLSAIEYRDEGGTTIAYEGGAVWKRTDAGVVAQKPPEFGYQDGSLQLEVVRIDGSVEDDDVRIDYDRATSLDETEAVHDQLFATPRCSRPRNVTITVTSDYHEGWQDHLESQLPASATVATTGSETVRAQIPLDVEYDVIDLPGSGPGEVVDTANGDGIEVAADGTGPASPSVYPGTMTFLGSSNAALESYTTNETTWDNETVPQNVTVWANETVPVTVDESVTFTVNDTEYYWDNETTTVWNNTTVRKRVNGTPPLEVSFVLDESGSMQNDGKMEQARDATRSFLSVMKVDQGHRVSVTGYDYCSEEVYSEYYGQWTCGYGATELDVTTYQSFTTNQSAASGALSELQVGGGTPIPQAIEQASDEFRASGNESNNQVLVLLTDGKDDDGAPYPYETAQEEVPANVTIYTIGVGDDVNDEVLENVATTGDGDGEYIPVTDAGELDDVFSSIARNETTEIVHYNNSTTVVDPNKEKRTVQRNVTVEPSETLSKDVNVSRTVGADEPYGVGDAVWVNATRTVADGETVVVNRTLNRTIEHVNGTEVVPVAVSREVTLDGSRTVTVNESVTLGEERTELENTSSTETTTHEIVVRRPTTLSTTYNDSSHSLWGGRNLNALDPAVDRGSFSNVVVEEDSTLQFLPSMHACADNTTHDEQISIGGTDHNLTTCTSTGSEVDLDEEVSVYTNGETLPAGSAPDWQASLREMLTVDGTHYYADEDGTLVASNLSSNQAIVVVEASDAAGRDSNNVVLLVELGQSTETSSEHLVSVEVTSVSASSDDDD
ncbi:VWA domain-containing protein [Halorubellus sp. JP-L1]|uniref:vWA domain-containing protein n=1 Tax=Halorubellus sp. JP-L1 TaxID=2715753 RepID=UPI00140E8E71|nr:vWA domain-containing protein [Halorubellus sp. JP-L1]NHN41217.1 VWA domain-containing protein [Halorubellus sp. JP-L1]